MPRKQSGICCDMRLKVGLGIDKIYPEDECGVSDAALADFHDFNYTSPTNVPVMAALTIKFCPWCGAEKTDQDVRRTTEIFHTRDDG